jgi:hypothetical protein
MQEMTKNSKNTSQCGSATRTADQSSRSRCRGEKSEPSADALRASADGASRTQDLAIFQEFSRPSFHPQCGSSTRSQHLANFTKTQFPPAVRVIHPQSDKKNPVFTRSAGHPSAAPPAVRVIRRS